MRRVAKVLAALLLALLLFYAVSIASGAYWLTQDTASAVQDAHDRRYGR